MRARRGELRRWSRPLPPPSVFAPLSNNDDLAAGLRLCALYQIETPRRRGRCRPHGGAAPARLDQRRARRARLAASNVIFVNGRLDPYSSVSVLPEQVTPAQAAAGVRAVAVANGSHCCGMDAATPDDPPISRRSRRR